MLIVKSIDPDNVEKCAKKAPLRFRHGLAATSYILREAQMGNIVIAGDSMDEEFVMWLIRAAIYGRMEQGV